MNENESNLDLGKIQELNKMYEYLMSNENLSEEEKILLVTNAFKKINELL